MVPLPARSIRPASTSGHRKQRTRYGATRATGGTSAHGASRTACAPCPRVLKRVRHTSPSAPGRLKVGSIQRRLNAIAEAHKAVGLESPTHSAMVRNTMKGIRRTKGTAPAQKAATLTDDIRAMVDATDAGLIGAAGPGTNPARVRRGVPPVGTGGAGRGRLRVRQGRPDGHVAAVENRSGRGGPQDRDTVRIESRDVPGSHNASVDGTGGNQRAGRCSARSIGMGRFSRAGCPVSTWRAW